MEWSVRRPSRLSGDSGHVCLLAVQAATLNMRNIFCLLVNATSLGVGYNMMTQVTLRMKPRPGTVEAVITLTARR